MEATIVTAIIGAIATITAAYVTARTKDKANVELKKELAQFREKSPFSNPYGIRIASHSDRTRVMDVPFKFEMSGTYERPIPAKSLEVFVRYDNDYWPAMRIGQYVAKDGVWRAQIELGGGPAPRIVMVTTIGKETQELVKKYWQLGDAKDEWHSIKAPVADLIECDRVIVNRV